MLPQMGPMELLLIFLIVVVVFGAGKIAELGGALGRGIREFKRASAEEPPPPALPSQSSPRQPSEDVQSGSS
ncbi:MAG TPA: twin-arginine translocase TatA/TatE family subunit [Chloroflexota bacterium]